MKPLACVTLFQVRTGISAVRTENTLRVNCFARYALGDCKEMSCIMTEKKSERLEVRLGYQEKTNFVEACETQGDTPSFALRRFIRGYVRRADADLFASAWRGLGRGWKTGLFLGSVSLIGLAIAGATVMRPPNYIEATDMDALTAQLGQKSDGPYEKIDPKGFPKRVADKPSPIPVPKIDMGRFSELDEDQDGLLQKGEILANDHHLHRVLDIDSELGVSPAEFYTKGVMHYRVAKSWEMRKAGTGYQFKHEGKVEDITVTFDLTQNPVLIYAARPLEDAVTSRPDRTVIWTAGEMPPYLTWTNDTHPIR